MLDYQAGTTPLAARHSFPFGLFFLGLLIIAFLIVAIYLIVNRRLKYLKSDEYKAKEKARLTQRKDIVYLEKEHNLSKDEAELLWEICSKLKATNIIYKIKNLEEIFDLFKKAYFLFRDENASDQKIFNTFTLLYKIENIIAVSKAVPSTKHIPVSTVISYIALNEMYPFPLVKNTESGFVLEIPKFFFESPRRPKVLVRSRFTFKTNQGLSYNFVARIMRYDNNTPEQFHMIVAHSDDMNPQVQRHFKREVFERACSFSPIQINKTGTSEEILFSKKEYPGTTINLSAGGCCIKTDLPIKEGQNISLNIPDVGNNEQIIGIIKNTRRLPVTGYAVHIQFLQISVKAQNKILSLVYKYEL